MENKTTIDKDIQSTLSKLISDEWFAGNIYKQFVFLVKPEERAQVAEQFLDTATDELDDHLVSLVSYATANRYDVPTTYNELKKKADKEDVKLFESCKKNEDVIWYVGKAIEAEQRAIETYEKYVDAEYVKKDQDLHSIVQNNYYDEIDHLKTFQFLFNSLESLKNFPK